MKDGDLLSNLARGETAKIRNRAVRELRRIYDEAWKELEKSIVPLIEDIYLDDETATEMQRLEYSDEHGKTKLVALIVAAVVLSNKRAVKRINQGLDEVYEVNADDVRSYILRETGVDIARKKASAQDRISAYTKKSHNQRKNKAHVSRTILREIDRMLREGKGTREISRHLNRIFYSNRVSAFRTTLTETTRIQSRGRIDMMREAVKYGFRLKKIWRHQAFVDDPRDWHVEMDGEQRELNEKFSNGLLFPGDPSGAAREVINCHCWLDEELVKD